jgi:hypothetical protein
MDKIKYVKIHWVKGNGYIHPWDKLAEAIAAELDCAEIGDTVTLEFSPIEMSEEEFNKLPKFAGH